MWTPEQAYSGLYYVETYVWNGMEALTSPGPVLQYDKLGIFGYGKKTI